MPDSDQNVLLCLQIEVSSSFQTLLVGSVEVDQLGPAHYDKTEQISKLFSVIVDLGHSTKRDLNWLICTTIWLDPVTTIFA